MVGEDLFEVMTLELRHEDSEGVCHVNILENRISSRVNSMYRGPEGGVRLAILRNSKEVSMARAW